MAAADLASDDVAGEAPDGDGYPRTIQKIWYRTGEDKGFTGPKYSGDLMITRESLEFFSKKADISIPCESIGIISFGKMRGDVNTDWVVLTVHDGDRERLIGFRDGRKLGYGARTPEIFETVLDVAEELGWGQFSAPEGLEPYTELDHVMAVAVPEGWPSYHHEMISSEGSVFWGTVVFTPVEMTSDAAEGHFDVTERELALEKIQRGEEKAWVLGRLESRGGMSCDGFTDKGLKTLVKWISRDPFLSVPFGSPQPSDFEPTPVGTCQGVRLVRRNDPSSAHVPVMDLRAASHGNAVVILALRTTADEHEADLKLFERAMPTLAFAITR
jgi:hypothetical protein